MSCSVMRVLNLPAHYDISRFSDGLQCPVSNMRLIDAVVSIPCGHTVNKTAVLKEQDVCLLCQCTVRVCCPNFIIRSFTELFSRVVIPTAVTRSEMDDLSTSLECPVSGDFLTDAVIVVPCGHTISEIAARSMYGSMTEGVIEKQGHCPLCCRDVQAYYPNHLARLFAEMLLHVQGWRSYDAKWGALIANLQDEGYSSAQIDEAKNTLASIANDVVITAEMKTLYTKVFPKNQNECVAEIKKQLLEFTEDQLRNILGYSYENPEREYREFVQSGSFINEKLRMLRWLGECEIINKYFRPTSFNPFCKEGAVKVEALVNEVLHDFSQGAPTAFSMMAYLLGKRRVGYSFCVHPVADGMGSMTILHRLADLGDEKAKDELCSIYTWNCFGKDLNPERLIYTTERRLQEIRKLALTGHAGSQHRLGETCYHRSLGEDRCDFLTEQMRRQYIQELWECEVPHNYYLQCIIKENKIGELSYGLSLKERLEILHQRAEQGDKEALLTLYHAYQKNQLCYDNLSQEIGLLQRMTKMKELKERHPSVLNVLVTGCAHLSDAEYLEEIEGLAFHQNHQQAQNMLAAAYATNKFDERFTVSLHMSFDTRLEKLRMLAHKNCSDAQRILLQYYGFERSHSVPVIVKDADVEQCSCVQLSDEVIDSDVLRWALLGNDTGIQIQLSHNYHNTITRNFLSLLFTVRASLL